MKAMKKSVLAAAVVAGLGFGAGAQASIVDLFDDPPDIAGHRAFFENALGSDHEAFGPSASILGGYRDLYVEITAIGSGGGSADLRVGGGQLDFSTATGVNARGVVQWDGNDNSPNLDPIGLRAGGTTGANLIDQVGCPAGGCDRFLADVLLADLAFEYQIKAYTDAANFSVLTANTLFPVAGSTSVDYLFDWFNLANGDYFIGGLPFNIERTGTVDFTNIGALELDVNSDSGTVSVDLSLGAITKTGVPEPGALALVGVALLAAGVAGRRRKAAKA